MTKSTLHNTLRVRRLLDDAEASVSFSLTGPADTNDRRYTEAVAKHMTSEGRKGNWPFLVATIVQLVSAGTAIKEHERTTIMCRALQAKGL